jgi:simple sugar transport system ATP-binding protein
VDGSGQRELAEAIVGLRPIRTGRILVDGVDVAGWNAARRMAQGIAYIPEDRQREGLILDFSVAENLLLGRQRRPRFGGGRLLDLATVAARGDEAIRSFRVRAPNSEAPVLTLSGGNQQKVLVARALAGSPRLLVAMQPTRGLDVGSTQFVYQAIRDACRSGMAAVVFSLDLDEILDLSDVVAVMYDGAIVGALPRRLATVDRIGRLMVGAPDASGAAREGA